MTAVEVPGDGIAIVTGASSGIGRELARGLAARGHALLLVARRADRLTQLAVELNDAHGVAVEVWPCDLADREQRAELVASVRSRHVAVLCNNAGFATCGPLAGADAERELAEVEVNTAAMHELTLAALPAMLARRRGSILVTGSTAGMQPVPTAATYAATKAFANTFAEALHVELRGSGVSCTLLAPGPVRTEFARVGGVAHIEATRWFAWTSPERVAHDALAGMARGARVVVPGPVAKVQALTGRHLPRGLLFAVLRMLVLPRLRGGRRARTTLVEA
jgi:short-subunit dehydrogenase